MNSFTGLPEDFLHFIWRTLRFELSDLKTGDGRSVALIHPGIWNHDQGPDFLDASLRIDGMEWHGHVELHLATKDWYRHKHQKDPQYNSTVLHVVLYSEECQVVREDGTVIPEIELGPHISSNLVLEYDRLRLSQDSIACASQIEMVGDFHRTAWLERLSIERIGQKAEAIQLRQQQEFLDWNQVLWEEMAGMMGGPVNREGFREMASRLPYRLLASYRSDPLRIPALVFGSCGLLSGKIRDPYHGKLKAEWEFLSQKHGFDTRQVMNLRFMRMRPASFPTIRLAQLIQLLLAWPQLTELLSMEGISRLMTSRIEVEGYWLTHFRFGKESAQRRKALGSTQKEILIMNVITPMAWLYHRAHGREGLDPLVEDMLSGLSAENNRITRMFEALKWKPKDAFQSQGMIQLKKHYCDHKACLKCQIGNQILKSRKAS